MAFVDHTSLSTGCNTCSGSIIAQVSALNGIRAREKEMMILKNIPDSFSRDLYQSPELLFSTIIAASEDLVLATPQTVKDLVDNMATTLSGRYTATKAGKKFISRIVSALRAKYIENSVRLGLASERLVYETALGSAEVPQRVIEAIAKLAGTKSTWI